MALRVLLADNSETIKKAIQVSLQDYAIDLRVVNLGVDVLDVAIKFKPDIIFVDILLQKRSGYDVAKELKTHAQLRSTPVVLMWSGFMEFDEQKAKDSLSDATLEKPFDAQALRELIQKFVSKTQTNPLSGFLDLPTIPKQEMHAPAKKSKDPLLELEKIKNESQKFAPITKAPEPPVPAPPPHSSKSGAIELPALVIEENDTPEDFEIKPLSKPESQTTSPHTPDINELTKSFVLDLPEDASDDDISLDLGKIESIEDLSFLQNPQVTQEPKKTSSNPQKTEPSTAKPPASTTPHTPVSVPTPTPTHLQPQKETVPPSTHSPDMEKLIQEEVNKRASEIIEKVAWQVIPELASQIIKKELDRLLKDSDS